MTLQDKLKKSFEVYYNTIHGATGLTPNEVLDVTNLSAVKKKHFSNRIEKYKKLFKEKQQEKFNLNDHILTEDAIHKYKD